MAPTDDELHAMTGVNDMDAAAIFDHQCLESYMNVGFSRNEAMALMITLKRSYVTVILRNEGNFNGTD